MSTRSLRHPALTGGLALSGLFGAVPVTVHAAQQDRVPAVTAIDDTTINRASKGVTLFVIDHALSGNDPDAPIAAPCPLLTTDEFGWFMGQQGLSPNIDGWAVDVFIYDDIGEGAPGLSCGIDLDAHVDQIASGAPHGALIEAMLLPPDATFADALAFVDRAVVIGPGGPEIGGEFGGRCYSANLSLCVLMWHRSGLVITLFLGGPAAEVTQDRSIALLTSMLSTMVQGLVDYAGTPPPPTSTVAPVTTAAPTTAAAPPTTAAAPVTTAAPATTVAATVATPAVPPTTVGVAPPPTTAAVSLPPSSVPSLTPTSTVGAPTPSVAPAGVDVAAARAGLAEFIASNPVGTDVLVSATSTVQCPASGPSGITEAMTAAGLTPTLDEFRVEVDSASVSPGVVHVSCGGDVIGALVSATGGTAPGATPLLTMYDITGAATIEQVVAERPGLTVLQANAAGTGGDLYGGPCEVEAGSPTFCVRIWHREGLVVTFEMAGTTQPGLDDAATDVALELVRQVLGGLSTR